ncbi:thioredoxin domain-containing protein [Caulobacter henricii]|uniref:Thiol:disulfide interchange protein n=1 Tax=Caulobacter henricii TaxID=69395 RepID=A0A0P0NWR7_9CAUL|nr:thioredoxin domain-containing protein [Caulobacter henricii]ALL12149.1 thiol:disulfide interchange protein [Caulobacter henricii]
MPVDRRTLIASGLALAAGPGAAQAAAMPAAPGDMVLGLPNAPAQLVVFASPSCSHCAHWWTGDLPAIRKAYIDNGKVRLVLREFLTEPVEFAAAAFLLARRVGAQRYFEVLDAVFARQTAIFESGELFEGLQAIGKAFGLSEAQFAAALGDQKALDALNERVEIAGVRDKVNQTPTFFLNGRRLPGELTVEGLKTALAKG